MAGAFEPIVQQIRDRLEIVELVGRHVPLKKAGSSYKGCCPFHQEKTPSFFVHPQRQFYYCFGCGAKGDMFNFLMEYEGKSFREVITSLGEELGLDVAISQERREKYDEEERQKEKLRQINQLAKLFFVEQLKGPKGEEARTYFASRGIDEKQQESFGLGYAPDSWEALTHHLQEKGYSNEEIALAGLNKKAERSERHYDRFRHRVIFPIWNRAGQIVGFGGRVLRSDDGAKYLNSPESPLFQKSHLLYGLDRAHKVIRRSKRGILVEGYMDVITMHQFGFEEAVATLGTSLTEHHVKELKRYAERLVLLFDADAAGFRAAERALGLLLPVGLSVDMLSLPEGEDPDSYLREHGRAHFEEYLAQEARPAFDAWIEHLLVQANDDPAQVRAVSGKVLEVLQGISDAILKDLYLKRSAELLGVEEASLRRQSMHLVPKRSPRVPREPMGPPSWEDDVGYATDDGYIPEDIDMPSMDGGISSESSIVGGLVRAPDSPESRCEDRAIMDLIKLVIEHHENRTFYASVSEIDLTTQLQDPLWKDVWLRLLDDVTEGADTSILIDGVLDSVSRYPTLRNALALSLIKSPVLEPEIANEMLPQILQTLERLEVERQIRQLTLDIREASREGDEERERRLYREKIALQTRLPRLSKLPGPAKKGARPLKT